MEHIKHIEIRNFKSIKHCVIDGCKRINVFVGAPNVGKSNILEAMSLFQLNNIEVDLSYFLRTNTYRNLFFNGNAGDEILVKVNQDLTVNLSIVEKKLRIKIETISGKYFQNSIQLDDSLYNVISNDNVSVDGEDFDKIHNLKIRKYLFNEEYKDASWFTIDKELYTYGTNLVDVINDNSTLKQYTVELFKKFNLGYSIDQDNKKIGLIRILNDGSYVSFPYEMIADTLQRLIFHFAAIKSNKNAILLLEEPEAQMYPPYISKLIGEIIADENNNQFFIATHSPYVLNDLMEDAKENLAIYLVYENKGETKVQRLNEQEMHDAYQYGSAFFMNIPNFIRE